MFACMMLYEYCYYNNSHSIQTRRNLSKKTYKTSRRQIILNLTQRIFSIFSLFHNMRGLFTPWQKSSKLIFDNIPRPTIMTGDNDRKSELLRLFSRQPQSSCKIENITDKRSQGERQIRGKYLRIIEKAQANGMKVK